SVTLTASPAGGSYLWSNGATTQSITVFGSGTFSVTVTVNGCSATSAGKSVTVNSAPLVSITGPSTFCAGTPITLDAGPGFSSYLWSTGATTPTITDTPAATTTYRLTVLRRHADHPRRRPRLLLVSLVDRRDDADDHRHAGGDDDVQRHRHQRLELQRLRQQDRDSGRLADAADDRPRRGLREQHRQR